MDPIMVIKQAGSERSVVYFYLFNSIKTGFIEKTRLYILPNREIKQLKDKGFNVFVKKLM